jgi:hypothetical protein
MLYPVWLFYDRATPERGGRVSKVRHWRLWKWVASYFPAKLHKQAALPCDRNYIFCCHPHGFSPIGVIFNLMTEADGFSEKFPGFSVHVAVRSGNYYTPFSRELMLYFGAIPSTRNAINYLLDRRNGIGNVVVLVVGGTREIQYSQPGKYVFLLRSRRGFVRIALEQGASLVPVVSFGEVDVYEAKTKFDPFVSLPRKCPINTVVGEPIHVQHVAEPTVSEIEDLYAQYVQALTNLFETNKAKFGIKDSDCITFV